MEPRFECANRNDVAQEGNLSAALGPIGRSAEAGVAPQAAIYTYSRNQGIFAGVSLEGTVIAARYEANEQYYGKPVFRRYFFGRSKTAGGRAQTASAFGKILRSLRQEILTFQNAYRRATS